MSVTPIPVLRGRDLCGLSALASMLFQLARQGDCIEDELDMQEYRYAVPDSSLAVVSQLDIIGALSLIVRDGDTELFRLCGDSSLDMALGPNRMVTVYDTAQSAGQLTVDQLEHLHRAIATVRGV